MDDVAQGYGFYWLAAALAQGGQIVGSEVAGKNQRSMSKGAIDTTCH